jgi:hypothetical protein
VYQPQTQFPAITTRESWSQLIGVYDDDTGDPINLTNTSGQGTFASWAVQISATLYGAALINTTSLTSLTIGNGPFTATIPSGLAITPGQFVKFLSQANNTNWMQGQITAYNPATGVISFNIATVSIELEIRRISRHGSDFRDSGYGANYTLGSYDWGAPILSASIGNGITIVDRGIFQIYFSETQFRSLGSGMHSVAATLASADGIDVRQLFLGRLPVLSGNVTN